MTYLIFGESPELKEDSIYSYSNSFSFDIMRILGEDERFLDINQADILNSSMALLMICIMQFDNPRMREYFMRVLLDYDELKDTLLLLIKDGRMRNNELNKEYAED